MPSEVRLSEFDSLGASVDGAEGSMPNGKTIWTTAEIAAYLNRSGAGFLDGANHGPQSDDDDSVINFGFFNNTNELWDNGYVYELNGGYYAFSEYFNFAPFTEEQREATREAIGYWDDVLAVSFRETSADDGDLNFGNLASAPQTQAYARLPTATVINHPINSQIIEIGGDVWVSASQTSNFQLDEGLYGLNTLVHETGHALGLSHPGAYNFSANFQVTYANGAEYYQDARNYTIMSYWNPRDIGARDFDWDLMAIAYGSTPMVHDILAAQAIYGADMTTRTGDTVYGFNSTADRDAFDFEKTAWPTMTIWDAGGNDTLDASGFNVDQLIDLTPGSLSSIGGLTLEEARETLTLEQVNANRAEAGYGPVNPNSYASNMAFLEANPDVARLTDNVGIAYETVIENAVGGGGDDVLIGNHVSNNLDGGAGNDVLIGADGLDYLTGGSGNDIFVAAISETTVGSKTGEISLDVILDFTRGEDVIDLSGIDANAEMEGHQEFTWVGRSSGKGEGELSINTYGNVNAAEKALGIDIDGVDGKSSIEGPVTVVLGNTDGGAAEFALVLLDTKSVTQSDFAFA